MVSDIKGAVTGYWDTEPCGTRNIPYPVGSFAFFEEIETRRKRLDGLSARYASYNSWAGKKVLEVGCGVGTDLVRFSQSGACVTGVDLSPRSVLLAKEHLKLWGCKGEVAEVDAECLPYDDGSFDFAITWGVLHHMPNPSKAIGEIYRVLKNGGKVCAMLYHKPSIVALQMWLVFGLLKGKPLSDVDSILYRYHESVGTKAYTVEEARGMFSVFRDVIVKTHITSYDLRLWRDIYLPLWLGKVLPQKWGWNMIAQGYK